MNTIRILKIGGGAGIDPTPALADVAGRVQAGERWIVVHGASDAANTLSRQMGIAPQTLTTPGGHSSRYTNAQTLEIFCAAAGQVNARVTATLCAEGAAAVGLCGVGVLRAERKTAIRALVDGRQVLIRDDFSGTLQSADRRPLAALLEAGCVPVVSPIALGGEGERLNVDGDLGAAMIAVALGASALVILSNVPGLLRDVSDEHSLIRGFTLAELPHFGSFALGRMKKKVLAAERALQGGVARVMLADARTDAPLTAALAGAGTHITQPHVTHQSVSDSEAGR
jgi:acetylglutamate/LysW-gamma-L-alpha-aminoadipate kinase